MIDRFAHQLQRDLGAMQDRVVEIARDPEQTLKGVANKGTASNIPAESASRYDPEKGGVEVFVLGIHALGDPKAELRVRGEKPNYVKP